MSNPIESGINRQGEGITRRLFLRGLVAAAFLPSQKDQPSMQSGQEDPLAGPIAAVAVGALILFILTRERSK